MKIIACSKESSKVSQKDVLLLEEHLKAVSTLLSPTYIKEIELLQPLLPNCFFHVWYSGDFIKFRYKNNFYYICATGSVIATLFDNSTNSCIASVKDKNNNGSFKILHKYLKSDIELSSSLTSIFTPYKLKIKNNNSWKLYCKSKDGNIYNHYTLNSMLLSFALREAINLIF